MHTNVTASARPGQAPKSPPPPAPKTWQEQRQTSGLKSSHSSFATPIEATSAIQRGAVRCSSLGAVIPIGQK